jgi:hypothetical protein
MKVELLAEPEGETFTLHITGIRKSDVAELEHRLQQPIKAGMYDRYGATESLNSILNGLIALTGREQRNERNKAQPDTARIDELKRLGEEVWAINEDTKNFSSVERMQELIDVYSPILLAEKKKALS